MFKFKAVKIEEINFWGLVEAGDIDLALNIDSSICPKAHNLLLNWLWQCNQFYKRDYFEVHHNSVPIYANKLFCEGEYSNRNEIIINNRILVRIGLFIYSKSFDEGSLIILGHSKYVKQIGSGLNNPQYNRIKKSIINYIRSNNIKKCTNIEYKHGKFVDADILPF